MKYLGFCHLIALALHRLRGYPIVVFYGKRDGKRILVHAGVLNERGNFEDETGDSLLSPTEYKEYLRENNPKYEVLLTYIFHKESLKWKMVLKKTGAKVNISSYLRFYLLYKKKPE